MATQLAELARSLERSGHKPDHVAAFLTRALFSMFAEDVGLLPKGSFLSLLQSHRAQIFCTSRLNTSSALKAK
ncbi:MAG TPA: type IIL restriction-modification enzyme MmeI [Polaromonas sp.]|nr:type IIL restriction-modification enzyme MmeI [Polaromonas sp.]